MIVPAWLVPLMGLLGLLTIAAFVEVTVNSALFALHKASAFRDDMLARSLVSEAALFKCGLIDLVRGKASVHGIEKQMNCKIVPQCTKGRRVQSIRLFAVLLTLAMAFVGEYFVFFVTQKTRTIGSISTGVQVISFDGDTAAASLNPTGDCAIVDETSATENSMTQYIYETCLVVLDKGSVPESNRVVNELYFNFSTNVESNIEIAMERQGGVLLKMALLDYVTTFEYERVAVGYRRKLKPVIDVFVKGFGCSLLTQNLVTCGDLTPDDISNIYLLTVNVLMKSARKRMANTIYMFQSSPKAGARKLVNIDQSIIRYSFVHEIGNARGISLIVLSAFGILIWCYKMMTVSELAHMIRAYEAVEGYSASTIYGMERQEKHLKLHVDSLSGQGHLTREPITPDHGNFQNLGGRVIVTGGQR
jgi:hypothetical protein